MQRKGFSLTLGNVLVQLIIGGMVFVALLSATASTRDVPVAFQQNVLATDNALLLESLFVSQDGVLQIGYNLENADQEVTLTENTISFRTLSTADSVTRSFARRANTQVHEETFVPRLYEYVKTTNTLTANVVTAGDACPILASPPDWSQAIIYAYGHPQARRILDDAALPSGATIMYEERKQQGRTNVLGIVVDRVDDVTITYGSDAQTFVIACLMQEELVDTSLQITLTEDENRYTNDGVLVTIPESLATNQEFAQALECALIRVQAQGVTPRGC